MSLLEIKDLHVSVETEQGTKQILKGVDLTVRQGEIHAIMGPNGSGKSTLAYSIAGHPKYHVEGGSVLLDGVEVRLSPAPAAVLAALVANPGNVVSRRALLAMLPSGTAGSEHAVEMAVARLRSTIGTKAVQTVVKRGYRLAVAG